MRVLIIEDNNEIAECIQQSLQDMGITSDRFTQGGLGLRALRTVDYDLLILDLNLPDIDGLHLLRALRSTRQNTAVLIVSARISIEDRVGGLDLGADDYLTKPFNLHELEARVRALLRRSSEVRNTSILFGNLEFDQSTREFRVGGNLLELSPRERSVLEVLIRKNGNVTSKEKIADQVFNFDDEAGVSSIEIYVHRLRKKLSHSDVTIITRRNLGYALNTALPSGGEARC